MNSDFSYLAELAEDFFSRQRIVKSLQIIENRDITGWEVWFQVEFAYFLCQHGSEPEWWREWPVDFDKRIERERYFCRPDFIIRKKGWRRESYIALEVKQHPDPGICLSNMMKDVIKISKVKVSSLDIRTFWVLGIHKRKHKSDLKRMISLQHKAAGIDPPDGNMAIRYIPRSNFAYTIF